MINWNIVTSQLPSDNVLVFIVDIKTRTPGYDYRLGYLKEEKWYTHFDELIVSGITHWAYLSSDYPVPKRKAKYWCDCDWPNIRMGNDTVICIDCEGIIRCELCENDQPATVIHIDYKICEEHEDVAINAVANRRW